MTKWRTVAMQETKKIKGIRIRVFNYITIIITCILYAILIYQTTNIAIKYQELLNAMQDYISCEEDAHLLSTASDYLTEQVRLYAIDMDKEYMNAYFTEINTTQRRNQALSDLQKHHSNDEIYTALQNALKSSDSLTEREIYSMKLISIANDYDMSDLPEEVQNVEIDAKDLKLTNQEMIKKGQSLVFDTAYQQAKEEIQNYISQVTEPILEDTQQQGTESAQALKNAITQNRIYLSLLLIINILSFAIIILLIVKPLRKYVRSIQDKQLLTASGAYELQYLALTYNAIYTRNATNEAILRKKAERDALTNLLNRGAFDQVTELLEDNSTSIALLLIDVDKFKLINDGYGHSTGDEILKKVAQVLTKSFRSSDHIARIGGDEFAIIMSDATHELKSVIQTKVENMNQTLTHPTDGLPPISLSIGVTFSTNGYSQELFKQADVALYQVKENGRCGCAFYEPES
jgi:diguanylate cyclase (GGDEF)-like protein